MSRPQQIRTLRFVSFAGVAAIGLGIAIAITSKDVNEGALWTPVNLTVAPDAWLDPSNASAVTQSGGRVSQVADLSGNARHATQATSGNQPLLTANAINGLPALGYTPRGPGGWRGRAAAARCRPRP